MPYTTCQDLGHDTRPIMSEDGRTIGAYCARCGAQW